MKTKVVAPPAFQFVLNDDTKRQLEAFTCERGLDLSDVTDQNYLYRLATETHCISVDAVIEFLVLERGTRLMELSPAIKNDVEYRRRLSIGKLFNKRYREQVSCTSAGAMVTR